MMDLKDRRFGCALNPPIFIFIILMRSSSETQGQLIGAGENNLNQAKIEV